MRFWDTSATVPLILEEPVSAAYRRLLRSDGVMAVWVLTRTEMVSAVRRKEREGDLDRAATRVALRRIGLLSGRWTEVDAVAPVREHAERLLAVHALTAADALQLAAALVIADDRVRRWEVVVGDERLAIAAEAEGFRVVMPAA